jgi:hypothetical protein
LWNYAFQGDVIFPVIRELLQASFPEVTIVPYASLPNTHPHIAEENEKLDELENLLVESGCDAVISGDGG